MLNARHSFTLLWKRLVAALSLVAAAALAPAVSAPAAGAGALGSRVGNGAPAANAASALIAKVGAGLVEGGQHKIPLAASGETKAKTCIPTFWQEIAVLRPRVAGPLPHARPVHPTHAARSGLTRAPPVA